MEKGKQVQKFQNYLFRFAENDNTDNNLQSINLQGEKF